MLQKQLKSKSSYERPKNQMRKCSKTLASKV